MVNPPDTVEEDEWAFDYPSPGDYEPLTYEIPDHLVDVEADADDIECEDECYDSQP
jgi:hypothetical protein